LAQAETIIPT